MGPLIANPTHEVRNPDQVPERCGPVRHRQAGVVAGDERSGSDNDECSAGHEDSETVKSTIVECGNGFQSNAPWVRKVRRDGVLALFPTARACCLRVWPPPDFIRLWSHEAGWRGSPTLRKTAKGWGNHLSSYPLLAEENRGTPNCGWSARESARATRLFAGLEGRVDCFRVFRSDGDLLVLLA